MRGLLCIMMMALAACQTAPLPAPQAAPRPGATPAQLWEQHRRDHPDTFIVGYDAELHADRERLLRQGLERDYAAVRAAVDFHLPPGNYTLQATGAAAAILRRQRVDSLTNVLVDLGYGAVSVANPARAKELVGLAARIGGEGKGDAAKLAPTVALAELVEVVTGPPDGAGRRSSTVRYRIIEPLKNAPPAGTLVRIPGGPTQYPDGTMGASTSDLEMIQPGRYILYLSQVKMTRSSTTPQPVDLYARVFGPLRAMGGSFVPVGESSHPEVTLDDLRDAIRDQMCTDGHMPVSNGAAAPKAC